MVSRSPFQPRPFCESVILLLTSLTWLLGRRYKKLAVCPAERCFAGEWWPGWELQFYCQFFICSLLHFMEVFSCPWKHTKANWKQIWRPCNKSVAEQELVWECPALPVHDTRAVSTLSCFLYSFQQHDDRFLFPPGYVSCIPLPKELKYICRSNAILPFCIRPCSFCWDSRLILTEGSMYFLPGFSFSVADSVLST